MATATVAWLPGCSTTNPAAVFSTTEPLQDAAAQRELDEARALVDNGRFFEALPRLEHITARFPNTPSAIEAQYWLGRAYAGVQDSRDAIDAFSVYLATAPDGALAKDARHRLRQLQEEYARRYPSEDALRDQASSLREMHAAQPGEMAVELELADTLWQLGQYDEAGRHYASMVERDSRLMREPAIRNRVEFQPDGRYVLLTPAERTRRQIESNPLQVVNTTSFRSYRSTFTQIPRYYSVAGQVINRSSYMLHGVAVHVTIYGFGSRIFDTTVQPLGTMNPGEIRAFSVRLSNFEDLNMIDRYEAHATFQK